MASFCLKCDRLFCQHTFARYQDERFTALARLEPVETVGGEAARQAALRIFLPRHAALEERSRTEYAFSEIEGQHMHALERTIAQLEGMAPVAPLIASHDPVRLHPVLT